MDRAHNDLKKGYQICHGLFLRLAGAYPITTGPLKYFSYFHVLVVLFVLIFFIVCLGITTYVTSIEFVLNTALQFGIMLVVPVGAIISSISHKSNLEKLFSAVGNNFFQYPDPYSDLSPLIRKARGLTRYFLFFWMGAIFNVEFINGLTYMFSEVGHQNYDKVIDGVYFNRLIPMWQPFRQPYLLSYTIEAIAQAMFNLGVSAIDSEFVIFSAEIYMQLKVLKLSLKNLKQRALHLYKSSYHSKSTNTADTDIELLTECYLACLKENAKHHQIIIEFFNNLQLWISYQLMFVYSSSALLLCFSAVIITESSDYSILFSTGVILLAELTHVFLYCLMGEIIIDESEAVASELYCIPWYDMTPKIKNTMIIMMIRSNKILKLNFKGLLWCSMNSFMQVISSSYSYFNLVRATRGDA